MVFLPPGVEVRFKNPCARARFLFFGWYVCDMDKVNHNLSTGSPQYMHIIGFFDGAVRLEYSWVYFPEPIYDNH